MPGSFGEAEFIESILAVFEFEFARYNKSMIWVECRVGYQNKTLLLNIRDISDLKNYQDQLVKSKTDARQGKKVKENLLAVMSHELRTPVNGIIGLTSLLRKTQLDELFNDIRHGGNALFPCAYFPWNSYHQRHVVFRFI